MIYPAGPFILHDKRFIQLLFKFLFIFSFQDNSPTVRKQMRNKMFVNSKHSKNASDRSIANDLIANVLLHQLRDRNLLSIKFFFIQKEKTLQSFSRGQRGNCCNFLLTCADDAIIASLRVTAVSAKQCQTMLLLD